MKWFPKKRLNAVLGLAISGDRLGASLAVRAKGRVEPGASASAALSLNLLQGEVEPAGLEIRRQLDAAGLRERLCVVALPADWIMSQTTAVPELSAADLTSFLQLEAEKGFPCDPAQLLVARSSFQVGGVAYVTQLAVRQEQVERLTAVLSAAGLKPVSFSLGLPALPAAGPAAGTGRVTVAVEAAGATLLVTAGAGIAVFRTCEATLVSGTGATVVNGPGLARELRITLEQLPAELRGGLRQVELCGDESLLPPLREHLAGWAAAAGLTVVGRGGAKRPLGEEMAEALATRWLQSGASAPEFLPPRPGRWALLLARYDSKRVAFAGFAAAAAVVLTLGAFAWQEYRRWTLRSEWGTMSAQVTELLAVQSLIHDYRPWYDTSFHSLSILRSVTESFPDNGSVTAKSFEIHGPSGVSVTGTARDNTALLHTLDQLRKTRQIQDLKVEQIRGKAPLQFTLSFRWTNLSGS